MHKRNITLIIEELALKRNKMAFISGPRQVGKTTLAKMFIRNKKGRYYNWDILDFRKEWTKSPQSRVRDLLESSTLIFDDDSCLCPLRFPFDFTS